MSDINTLLADFFVNAGDPVQAASKPNDPDVAITAATLPRTDSQVRATHLIDGINYFGALKTEIAALLASSDHDRFFYTNSWELGTSPTPNVVQIGEGTVTSAWAQNVKNVHWPESAFQLEDAIDGSFHPLIDDLKAMSQGGVDVRVLAWASPFLVNFQTAFALAPQYWGVNVHTLSGILDLRQIPAMYNKVVVNTLAHTLGAMHLKTVICGDSTGFRAYVGGIDFTQNRNAAPTHRLRQDKHFNDWHDVVIKLEGPGANGVYSSFEQLWNEQVTRSPKKFKAFDSEVLSHVDDTPLLDARETGPVVAGTNHTQVLRTLPTMNFSLLASDRVALTEGVKRPLECFARLISGFRQQKLSFAPDGIFEFRAAQRKAVAHAERHIYIEDQAMQNTELARWINNRMHEAPNLKLIMLFGGDPADTPPEDLPDMMDILCDSLDHPEERIVFAKAPYIVHAKVTIIDDLWAAIGSSNCWMRSFYTDGEINISVLDEDTPSFAAKLRKDLWGEHCGKIPGPDCDPLLDLDAALGIWRSPSWGTPPTGFALRQAFPADPPNYIVEPPERKIEIKTIPFAFIPCPKPGSDGKLPPCPLLKNHPEAMRGFEPPDPLRPASPSQIYRETHEGADSRLEY